MLNSPVHVFIDESERGAYLVGAALILPQDLVSLRRTLRALVLPRERTIHFNNESPSRKKQLLARFTATGAIRGRIYTAQHPARSEARKACMTALLQDLAAGDCRRLVIESREGRDKQDRQVIVDQQRQRQGLREMAYDHMRPYEEPLLWIADGLAWGYGAGGDWRSRTASMIEQIVEIGS
ncbi:MAG: hypothetical protein ACREP9_22690 [Candidatus Dormibacteraceae bacterium]